MLALAYKVGLLEGDGHVRATKRGLVVHFVSASRECCDWFLEQAQAITLTSPAAHSVARPNGPIYNVTLGDAAALRLLAGLQKAFSGTMVRKWGLAKSA